MHLDVNKRFLWGKPSYVACAILRIYFLFLLKIWVLVLARPITILGHSYCWTQGYLGLTLAALKSILGLVLSMTQGYFGCCSLWDPRIVGSWRSPRATCVLVLPAHRQAIQAPCMRLVCPTHRLGRSSARWPRPGAWPAGVACPAPGVCNPNGRASSLALGSCML